MTTVLPEVYQQLGTPDADKRRLVAHTIEKLALGGPDPRGLEALRASEKLHAFADRIELLEPSLWSFDHNFKLLLGDLSKGQVTGDWHEPGGPLAWADPNPADAEELSLIVRSIESWLAGKTNNNANPKVIARLGKPAAFKEKVWLARCLRRWNAKRLRRVGAEPVGRGQAPRGAGVDRAVALVRQYMQMPRNERLPAPPPSRRRDRARRTRPEALLAAEDGCGGSTANGSAARSAAANAMTSIATAPQQQTRNAPGCAEFHTFEGMEFNSTYPNERYAQWTRSWCSSGSWPIHSDSACTPPSVVTPASL